jgi:hypothetical protein
LLIFWLVMFVMTAMLAAPAAAQYQDVLLPQGVLQVTVEDQPINAVTSPVVSVVNPRIAGSLGTGGITIEIALADASGAVIRFPTDVNARGVFRQRPPEPLQAGAEYTLYINDAMVGQFSISPDAAGGGDGATGLELARLGTFPQDAGGAIAGLGLVPELSQYQSVAEVARIVAQASGNNTQEVRQQTRAALTAAGFVQRYQSSLAVPSANDPAVFEIQIVSVVNEYTTAEGAAAGYAASITTGEPVPTTTQIGEESTITSQSAVATQTQAEYQSLQLIFRQDRLLFVINYADLLNRPPDQAVLEALGQASLQRATSVLAGEAPALTQRTQQLSLTGLPRSSVEQYYEVIDGVVVPLFGEAEQGVTDRETAYAGTTDVSVSSFVSRGLRDDQTPEAGETPSPIFSYTTSIANFPAAEDATAWLEGLNDRLAADPLPGYLSFAAVADAPTFGEASATYQFTQQLEGQTAAGFRVYVQVGAEVAILELAAVPEAPLAALEPLVTAQVECLTAGACAAVADPPAGLPAAGDAPAAGAEAPAETPAADAPADPTEPASDLPAGVQREGAPTPTAVP